MDRILILSRQDYHVPRAVAGAIHAAVRARGWEPVPGEPWLTPEAALAQAPFAGVIAHVDRPSMLRAVRRSRLPAINVSAWPAAVARLPSVLTDEAAVGTAAARALAEWGLRPTATIGAADAYAQARCAAFAAEHRRLGGADPFQYTIEPGQRQQRLVRWLARLPRPFDCFIYADYLAPRLVDALHAAGLSVGRDLRLIGADGDGDACATVSPRLSTVAIDAAAIGAAAVAALAELRAGGRPRLVRIAPAGVLRHGSAERWHSDHPLIARAIAAWEADPRLSAADAGRACGCSRATIERTFRRVLGRTPAQVRRTIRDERLAQAVARAPTLRQAAARVGYRSLRGLTDALARARARRG